MRELTRNTYVRSRIKEYLYYLLALSNGYRIQQKTKLLLFCGGRVGSNLFLTALDSHPSISFSSPREMFINYPRVLSPKLLMDGYCAKSRTAIYGTKATYYDFVQVQKLDPTSIMTLLAEEGWKFMHLSRRNVFLWGVSRYIANTRKKYEDSQSNPLQDFSVSIVPSQMKIAMVQYVDLVRKEKALLHDIPHLSFTYEDDLLDPAQRQITCDIVFDFLGLESVSISTPFFKTIPLDWRKVVNNHEEVTEALMASPFAQHLIEANQQIESPI